METTREKFKSSIIFVWVIIIKSLIVVNSATQRLTHTFVGFVSVSDFKTYMNSLTLLISLKQSSMDKELPKVPERFTVKAQKLGQGTFSK